MQSDASCGSAIEHILPEWIDGNQHCKLQCCPIRRCYQLWAFGAPWTVIAAKSLFWEPKLPVCRLAKEPL